MLNSHIHLAALLHKVIPEGWVAICEEEQGKTVARTPLSQLQQGLLCALITGLVNLHESGHLMSKYQETTISFLCIINLNFTHREKVSKRLPIFTSFGFWAREILISVHGLHCELWFSKSCLILGQKSLFLVCKTIVSVTA